MVHMIDLAFWLSLCFHRSAITGKDVQLLRKKRRCFGCFEMNGWEVAHLLSCIHKGFLCGFEDFGCFFFWGSSFELLELVINTTGAMRFVDFNPRDFVTNNVGCAIGAAMNALLA